MSSVVFIYVGMFSVNIYGRVCGGMSFSGLHLLMWICKRGMIIGGVTNLESLCWSSG